MRIRHVILGQLTVVLFLFLGNVVNNVAFLQQQITDVPLIVQDGINAVQVPFTSVPGRDSQCVELVENSVFTHTIKVIAEDHPDHFSLFRNNLQLPIHPFVPIAAEERRLTLLELFPDRPFAVFRNRSAFFLREGCHDGDHELSVSADGVDVLFFEIDVHAEGL